MEREQAEQEKSYAAFISHASADRKAAETIVASLEAKGLPCWIAPRDIRLSANYPEEIIRGIEQSKCLVLVLSEDANNSKDVAREVERAANKGKPIYPVRLEDIPLSPTLEYLISMNQWLDAWKGLLEHHIERLAAAMRSEEEWVGNIVLKRRRRRMISSGIATLLALAVLVIVMIFGSDIRQLFLSPEKLAEEKIAKRNIPLNVEGLVNAILSADEEQLALFSRAGISAGEVTTAFSRENVALGFFENSKGKQDALQWFESVVTASLDPNMTVPQSYYGKQGILASALLTGNLKAAQILLKAGASPHVYQSLWLTEYSLPMFLFPYSYLEKFTGFNSEEKAVLAKAFADAGAVVSIPTKVRLNHKRSWAEQLSRIEQVQDEMKTIYGIDIPVATSVCETTETRICREAFKRTGFDWCKFAETLPKSISSKETDFHEFIQIDLVRLINIVHDKAYVLANIFSGYRPGYGLVEISKDMRSWYVYKFMDPATGMGQCKKDSNGNTPKNCWRRIQLVQGNDPDKLMLENYYTYRKLNCENYDHPLGEPSMSKTSSIDGAPMDPYLLTLHLIDDVPDTLSRDTLLTLTEKEVEHAQSSYRSHPAQKKSSLVFDRREVEERDPKFAASELAPKFGRHLRKLAENATDRVWVEHALTVDGYDHENKLLRLGKQRVGGEASNRKPELLPVFISTTKDEASQIPEEAKNLHLYELAASMPSRNPGPFLSIQQNRDLFVTNGILALDRVLQLDGLSIETAEAEQLAREFGGFDFNSSSLLRARVGLTIERVAKTTDRRQLPIVLAKVDHVEILKPDDVVLASFGPETFSSAVDMYQPKATIPAVVPPKDGSVLLNGETLDLLVVKHFPEHFGEAMTDRMMEARWDYEQAVENPGGGRFFKGTRKPDQQDRNRLAPQFRKWIFARTKQIRDDFILQVKGGLRSDGFSPSGEICLRKLRHWDPKLAGYIDKEDFQNLTSVMSAGPGPEHGWWWELDFTSKKRLQKHVGCYDRNLPSNISDILRLSGGFPVPSEDVLPRCTKGSYDCPTYGAEFNLKLSNFIFNKGLREFKTKKWHKSSAYVLKAKVTKARYFTLKSDKPFQLEFGNLLTQVNPPVQNASSTSEKIPKVVVETEPEKSLENELPPDEPYGPDVVGLRLGMSFKEAERIIRVHMEVEKILKTDRSMMLMLQKLEPYSSGRLFVAKNGKEYIAIYDEPPAVTGKVVGLWRRVLLQEDEAHPTLLLKKLQEKYGKADSSVEKGGSGGFMVSWGKNGKGYENVLCSPGIKETSAQSMWREEDEQPADLQHRAVAGYRLLLPQLRFHNVIGHERLERRYRNCDPVIEVRYHSHSDCCLTTSLVDQNRYSRMFVKSMERVEEGKVKVPAPKDEDGASKVKF